MIPFARSRSHSPAVETAPMTRSANTNRVSLARGEWFKLLGLVMTLVGAAWHFTLDINGRLAAVESTVTALQKQVDALAPRDHHVGKN